MEFYTEILANRAFSAVNTETYVFLLELPFCLEIRYIFNR